MVCFRPISRRVNALAALIWSSIIPRRMAIATAAVRSRARSMEFRIELFTIDETGRLFGDLAAPRRP